MQSLSLCFFPSFPNDGRECLHARRSKARIFLVQSSKAEALNANSTFLNIFSVEAYSCSDKYFGRSLPALAWDSQTQVWTPFSESLYLDILPEGCFDANEAGMKYRGVAETDSLTSYRASVSERTVLST